MSKLQPTALALAAQQAAQPLQASLAVYLSPVSTRPDVLVPVPAGRAIQSLLPPSLANECVVCRYQGEWILRADWVRPVAPGDVVEFHVRAQGGDGGSDPLRTLLTIALLVAAWEFAPYLTGEWGVFAGANTALVQAGLVMAGNLALNALLPVQTQGFSSPTTTTAYSIALSGNQAKLDGAIPVLYGYNRTYPDFCCQPYTAYDNSTSDQYYHALLAVGHGQFTIPRIEIDDTPLAAFGDVSFNVLPPGTAPSIVNPAVVTAPEVTGQELTPGVYVGGFAACMSGLVATQISFDVAFAALGVVANDGGVSNKSVSLRFEVRPIDDYGTGTGAWVVLGSETITAASASAVRRSFDYTLATPGRYLARAVRTSPKDTATNVPNAPQWVGLRAKLQTSAPLEPSVTHLEIRMRASEQLNGLTQRRIAVTSLRKLQTWSPGGGWSGLVETRNPAWALADKWRSTVYGDGLADSRIDLATLYTLAQTWDARQDRLDIVFDSFTDSESADQVMAAAGRAMVIRRNGVRTVMRDEQADVPVTAYGSRSIRAGSYSCDYGLATSQSADGYIIEYWSNRAWDWMTVDCPAPGVSSMQRPIRQRLLGVTGTTHATREGRYMAAKLVYRRRFPSWSTELQGILPAYGSPVVLAPALPGWGQSGDVVWWDAVHHRMGLSEPPQWTAGATHYISLQRDDGTLTDAIACTPGLDDWSVTLATGLDFTPVVDRGDRERPKYVFGEAGQHRTIVRVLGIEPAGLDSEGTPVIHLSGVTEDNRVHSADAGLLPAPGDTQDPISLVTVGSDGSGGDVDTGGGLPAQYLQSHTVTAAMVGATATAAFELRGNGQAAASANGAAWVFGSEWLLAAPVATGLSSLFESHCTVLSGSLSSGVAGTWQGQGSTRSWAVSNAAMDGSTLTTVIQIQLRDAATHTVLSSTTVTFHATSDAA